MRTNKKATVYLVGAGPGDPDLLTIKAERILSKCDVVVYDSLIPNEILKLVPYYCKRFFVGKRCGNHSFSQEQINKLLVSLSNDNSCIVRLKGGDPFMFGRGSEEAKYLVKNEINVEIVPGITSGMATPAYLGIPLTHRDASSSVTFVTGHEGSNKQGDSINWSALAKGTDTIVIYMGMHNLKYILKELLRGGLDPKTPCAIIHKGTLIEQQYIKSSLDQLTNNVDYINLLSPSIVIVGEVINYQVEECSPDLANSNLIQLNHFIKTKDQLNQVIGIE